MDQSPVQQSWWLAEEEQGGEDGRGKVENNNNVGSSRKEEEEERVVEVAVVGAGLSGTSMVYWLQQMGLNGPLVLVDPAAQPGMGASGHNAGHAWPAALHPFEQTSVSCLTHLCSLLAVPFVRCGALELLPSPQALQSYRLYWPVDESSSLWDHDRLAQTLPALAEHFFCGVFEENCVSVSSHALTKKLFASLGTSASLVRARVTHVDGKTLTLDDGGKIRATRAVILCNNAHLGDITDLPVRKVRGQAMAVHIEDTAKVPKMALSIDDSYEYYSPLGPNMVIVGGGRLNGEEETEEGIVSERVRRRLVRRLELHLNLKPGEYRITHEWTGMMGFTPDELPMAGLWKDNVYVLGGFSGHGLVGSVLAAKCIAKLIMGVPDEPEKDISLPEEWNPNRVAEPLSFSSAYPTSEECECEDWEDEEDEGEEDDDEDGDENHSGGEQGTPPDADGVPLKPISIAMLE